MRDSSRAQMIFLCCVVETFLQIQLGIMGANKTPVGKITNTGTEN